MIYQREIQLQTTGHRQMHDLTAEIAQVVIASRVRTGVANIFNVGSTGAIGTIEFEPGLQQDLPAMLDKPSRRAVTTATNKPGMMAMAIRSYRPRCLAHRLRSPSKRGIWFWVMQ